jgi:serine/threonine-protein kinase
MAERLGPYTLDKRIGAGGMADVFLAHGPMGVCVVKRPHPQLCANPEFVRMFLDEASLLAQLHHPGIAQIFDLGHVGNVYYLSMEYVPGFDLMTISLEHERHGELIAPELCARIVADVAGAMHYAHEARGRNGQALNIVHRDLSPHNILLSTSGLVKVIDFGVARASTATHRTQAGFVKGKYPYMSPEQITGQDIDRRVDVYALGLVLYELLTNVRAIAGDRELEQIENAKSARIRPVEQLRPNTPMPLRQILGGCLHPSPNGRYPTAEHLRVDLEKYLALERHAVGREDLLRLFRVVAAEVSHVDFAVEEPARKTEQEQAALAETLPPYADPPEDIGYARTAPSFPKPVVPSTREPKTGPVDVSPIPLTQPIDARPPTPSEVGPAVPPEVARAPTKLLPPSGVHRQSTLMLPPKRRGPVAALSAVALLLAVIAGGVAWWKSGQVPDAAVDAGVPIAAVEPVVDAGVPLVAVAPVVDAGVEPEAPDAATEAVAEAPVDAGGTAIDPEPVRVAVLLVESSPPGTVFADGKDWGETPVTLELMPGDYTVTVRNDDKGFTQTRRFTLAGGDRKKWYAAAPKQEPGTLEINAPPFAAMYVDGKKVTSVPVASKRVELPAGTHRVELVLEDPSLPKARKKKRTVRVTAGETTKLDVDMLVDD